MSSAAVGVALLASLHPSVVKYQSSTYSMFSIFPVAYWLRLCGIRSEIEAFRSKSGNLSSLVRVCGSSSSGVFCGGGESARGMGDRPRCGGMGWPWGSSARF